MSEGGVDPHAGSGPIPIFVIYFGCGDLQVGEYRNQQLTDRDIASATLCLLLEYLFNDLGFAMPCVAW